MPVPDAKPVVWMPTRLHPEAMAYAHSVFDVIQPGDERAAQWPELAEASVLRTGEISLDELERCKKLRIVTRNGVGYSNVPWQRCKELGIAVTNQPGSNARAVAEIVLGLTINTLRRLVELDRRLRRGELLPNIDWMAETIDDKVVGLVGMGDIARETAKKFWGAYESPILVYSPTSPPTRWTKDDPSGLPPIPHTRVNSLDELLTQADIVSLHCPLFEETRDMISTKQLALMKPTSVLINTARGGLIDEPALLHALKTRQIYGAGLDVVCHEPAQPDGPPAHPGLYRELFAQENVVVLPHAGAGTEKVQIDTCKVAVETALLYLRGEGIGRSKRVV